MPAIRTATFPAEASYISPGGVAEIRLLLQFPAGEVTHARVRPGEVSAPSWVSPCSEYFYVTSGAGELWSGTGWEHLDLTPDMCVRIAPGTPFQYRTTDRALEFLVCTLPQWRPAYHHIAPGGRLEPDFPVGGGERSPVPERDWGVDVRYRAADPDHVAPDGSHIWELGSESAGGLSVCSLPPDGISVPVRHRTVEEIWYVLSGGGQISRRHGDLDPWIDDLAPGTCVDIGLGITFQFRAADAGVEIAILTIPSWPGSGEAVTELERGTW